MKQGTLYIQDRSRETKVKTAIMVVLLAGLAAASLLLDSQIAILAVLGVWVVLSMAVTRMADKGNWYHREAPWILTDEDVTIDGTTISRSTIKRTVCTPRPGFQRKMFRGWVLKVETQNNVYQWYSYYQDTDNTQSVESLQALASELGAEWQTWTKA